MSKNTCENPPRVPVHNTSSTFAVVGAHFTTLTNFTRSVVVTVSLSAIARSNVPWSNSPKAYGSGKDKFSKKKASSLVEAFGIEIGIVAEKKEVVGKERVVTTLAEGTIRETREYYAENVPKKTKGAAEVKVDYIIGKANTIRLVVFDEEIAKKVTLEVDHTHKGTTALKEETKTKEIAKTEGTTRGYREVVAKKLSEVSDGADCVEALYEMGIVASISLKEAVDMDAWKVAEDKDHKPASTEKQN